MISEPCKKQLIESIDEAVTSGARQSKACQLVGITARTLQNWHKDGVVDKRKGSEKHVVRKLSQKERQKIIEICTSERFKDMNPYEIVAILAQESNYIASESTMYRVLRAHNMIHQRSNDKPRQKSRKPPQVVATGPNQVFTWDITWLHTVVQGIFLYAYVIIDIFDRSIVGWEIHDREDEQLARDLFHRLSKRLDISGAHLHSDNGNPMKGLSLMALLYTLGVSNSFSRPRVSDDNPFIESFFKTLKYSLKYPGRFQNIAEAREWMAEFIDWYNTEHLHSSIGYVTPQQRRSGEDIKIFKTRNKTMDAARKQFPERWGNRPVRTWISKDTVILNPDKKPEQNDQPTKKVG